MCGRRRRGVARGQPVVLLVRVKGVNGSTAIDSRQLISAPTQCNSTTQQDAEDHLGNQQRY